MKFDLVVLGGGPGGYVAAIRAAQRGLQTALVDRGGLGGTCLHRGCIPSKAYLAAAEAIDATQRAAAMGLTFSPPKIDFARLVARKGESVAKLGGGIAALLKARGVQVINETGSLAGPNQVRAGQAVLESRFIILATGTEPIRPKGFPFDGKRVVTTDELFTLEALPKNLLIVGGGVVGCEIACAYNLLGSKVTITEALPTILTGEDAIVSRTLTKIFQRRGIELRLGQAVKEVDPSFDLVLVAIGRRPDGDRLGLEAIGVRRDANGFVAVNERMETSVEGVYAVGDLAGKTMLAHGAMAEGISAVESIVGNESPIDYNAIPRVTYTIPEVASIGRTEEALKKEGGSFKTGRFSYQANGMAMIHEEEAGFVQVHAEPASGRILGATILGAHAADMIPEVALAMRHGLPASAISHTVHPHPSLSEVVHEAAEDIEGLAIHKAR